MLAFMACQSFVMMYQAGAGWQYGKRHISALSNDEFNKLTPEALLQEMTAQLRRMIPTVEKSMQDTTPMVKMIITQYGDFVREAIAALPEALKALLGMSNVAFNQGQSDIFNVRLSQDSQQFQYDRELYAGGPKADSLYEQDIKRQEDRDAAAEQSAYLEEQARRLAATAKTEFEQFIEQTPITPTPSKGGAPISKKAAGQSQWMMYNQLQVNITHALKVTLNGNNSSAQRETWRVKMRGWQQDVIDLLARYNFIQSSSYANMPFPAVDYNL